jgi:hypothetical protein
MGDLAAGAAGGGWRACRVSVKKKRHHLSIMPSADKQCL